MRVNIPRHVASFSGGKDSTAMVLRIIEEGLPLDDIVFFNTGWEFPQMLEHVARFEQFIGRTVTVLKPKNEFTFEMIDKPIVKRGDEKHGTVYKHGYGWPSMRRRWCTKIKTNALKAYSDGAVTYVGLASDEWRRAEKFKNENMVFPLIDWGMTEADCLEYCKARGFDWGGPYDIFLRVSCFCCPLQRLDSLRKLRKHFPDLWNQMLEWTQE